VSGATADSGSSNDATGKGCNLYKRMLVVSVFHANSWGLNFSGAAPMMSVA
jgi:hypothetical protein